MLLVVMGSATIVMAQRTVRGTVSSDSGEPLVGASVVVKGTSVGTTTNLDGQYSIQVPAGSDVLMVSYTGFTTKDVTIGASNVVDVSLSEGVVLETAVVTALGISRDEKGLGYAVQTVGSEQIERSGNANMLNSLTGKVAGVQITSSSGAAGASANVLIRGAASLTGNNQPLYVVDGVPIDNSQNGTENTLWGVAYSNRAIDINPDDIASISVLKGGAATALYGMRAANGVIMINTKSGTAGKMRVDVNSSFSIEQVNKLPEMQNTYSQGVNGGLNLTTTSVWGPKISSLAYDPSAPSLYYPQGTLKLASDIQQGGIPAETYDNVGNFFRTGYTYNNNISFSGGNDRSDYHFSVGNINQTGVVPNNSWERTSAALRGSYAFNSRLRTTARVAYSRSGGTRIQQGSNTSGVMLALMRMPMNFDNTGGVDPESNKLAYELPDGRQRNAYAGGGYDNPFWTAYNNPTEDEVDRIMSWAQIDYKFTDWLSAMYRVGNDFYSDRRKVIIARNSRTAPNGRIIEDQISNNDFNSDLIVKINPRINEDFGLNILLGNNLFGTKLNNLRVQGDNLAILGFYNMSNSATQTTAQFINRKRTSALYADLGVDFRNMVYLNVTLRNEKSTTLPDGNNSFFFPSFNGSFILTELPALSNSNILSFAKLRGSWSKIANDAPPFNTAQLFVRGSVTDGWTSTNPLVFPGFGVNSFNISESLANPNLKPEFATSREVGIDLRFWKNRLGIDFTYYNNLHEDLILSVPVAQSSGATAAVLNAGSMENVGYELLINANPVRSGKFNWDISLNWTKNVNEVLELAEGVNNVFLGGFVGSQTRAVKGEPYGSVFGDGWVRHANGQVLIGDNGFPSAAGQDKNIGNVLPNWLLGITNTVSYGNVSLSFLLDIKNGGYMWNGTRGAMLFFGTHKDTEDRERTDYVFDGVRADGSKNTIQVQKGENWHRLGQGSGFSGPAEDYVEQTDWVRLRELTLSWRLKKDWVSKARVSDAELFFTGRNLWLSTPYSGIDPETSLIGQGNAQGLEYFNMPNTKSYMFGLRFGF